MDTRLAPLRNVMQEKQYDGWILTGTDPHQSEYPPAHYRSLEWFCGFTGSAGTLILTATEAAFWTDSRYAIQARQELEGSIQCLVEGEETWVSMAAWLGARLQSGSRISFHGATMSLGMFSKLQQDLDSWSLNLEAGPDLPGQVWEERPALEHKALLDWQAPVGSLQERHDRLLAWMSSRRLDWLLVTDLDHLAWFCGWRGQDSPWTPHFLAWFLVGAKGSVFFASKEKMVTRVLEDLAEAGVRTGDYKAVGAWLQTLAPDETILMDPASASMYLVQNAAHLHLVKQASPLGTWAACTLPKEQEGQAEACLQDGQALVEAFMGAESAVNQQALDEWTFARLLWDCRRRQPDFLCESFPAIVGADANGAIVHYRCQEDSGALVGPDSLVLVDSGGHYRQGSTDVTRTLCFGSPKPQWIEAYTLVLKGQIRLATAVFPQGTRGQQLDLLARQPLWNRGMDYGHGTGHGIGHLLSVHAGPQRISPKGSPEPLQPGMVLSNEPGYYLKDSFGIRLENMMMVEPHPQMPGFLRFRTLTLCPYQRDLIDVELLSKEEIAWIDAYHHTLVQTLGKRLDRPAQKWLKESCRPLGTQG